jgi:hypothetical protein
VNFFKNVYKLLCVIPAEEADDFIASWLSVLLLPPIIITDIYIWYILMKWSVEVFLHGMGGFGGFVLFFWIGLLISVIIFIIAAALSRSILPKDLKDFSLRWPWQSE